MIIINELLKRTVDYGPKVAEDNEVANEMRLVDILIIRGLVEILKDDIKEQQENIKDCELRIEKMNQSDLDGTMKDRYLNELNKECEGYRSNMRNSKHMFTTIADKIHHGKNLDDIVEMNSSQLLPILQRSLQELIK